MSNVIEVGDTARRRVQAHFMAQNAVAPDRAIEYAPGRALEMKAFDTLRRLSIIRIAAPGHYWLDLDRMNATPGPKRRISIPKLLAVAVLATALAAFLWG